MFQTLKEQHGGFVSTFLLRKKKVLQVRWSATLSDTVKLFKVLSVGTEEADSN